VDVRLQRLALKAGVAEAIPDRAATRPDARPEGAFTARGERGNLLVAGQTPIEVATALGESDRADHTERSHRAHSGSQLCTGIHHLNLPLVE
jgi:hypothetical protein